MQPFGKKDVKVYHQLIFLAIGTLKNIFVEYFKQDCYTKNIFNYSEDKLFFLAGK